MNCKLLGGLKKVDKYDNVNSLCFYGNGFGCHGNEDSWELFQIGGEKIFLHSIQI